MVPPEVFFELVLLAPIKFSLFKIEIAYETANKIAILVSLCATNAMTKRTKNFTISYLYKISIILLIFENNWEQYKIKIITIAKLICELSKKDNDFIIVCFILFIYILYREKISI